MDKPLWMWVIFLVIILSLLIIDLGVFHRNKQEITAKESLLTSAVYILIAFLFGLFIWYELGINSFSEYLTGFLIEKTLALDNIFLISVIFSSLSIPLKYQHRVLFWGILGVIVLRGVMIGLGAQLITQFHSIIYLFSAILILTGFKLLFLKEKPIQIKDSFIFKFIGKNLRVTDTLRGEKFLVKEIDNNSGELKFFITPLFVALIMVEFVDLIFAIDSVPAIFAITTDPYIVYTSNIFAILGLRSLYFALAVLIDRFYYLKFSLAFIMIFIGAKVFIADILELSKFPPLLSLGATLSMLTIGCIYSLHKTRRKKA